jgi:hypothetical protein
LNLGENCRALIYSYLAGTLSLKKDIIPRKLQEFATSIEDIFKLGGKVIDGLIVKTLCDKINLDYSLVKDLVFRDAVEEIKKKSMS